jgi:dihydrolipoamide dehydrogenase
LDVRGKPISIAEWKEIIDDRLENPGQGGIYNLNPDDDREFDAIFIGGGAAGRFGSAYMRAMGGRQLMVEKWPFLGGSCPHEACVPHHVFSEAAREMDYFRWFSDQLWFPEFDEKRASITALRDMFLENRNVGHSIMNFQSKEQLDLEFILDAPATVIDAHTVEVEGRRYTAKNLVLCTGARPAPIDVPGIDMKGVYDWSSMLTDLDYEPNRCVAIGGSKTAMEYGSFFQATGCDTTILSRSPLMRTKGLHHIDEDMRLWVKNAMEIRGMVIHENAEPVAILGDGRVSGVRYRMADGTEHDVDCDFVFLGTGERALSQPFVDVLGVEVDDRGCIVVDNTMQTSVPGVWATGDLISGPMEIFKARKSGCTAARNIMGEHVEFRFDDYADFLHTTYEVAWTGLSEDEAREQFENVMVIQMPPKGVDPSDVGLPCSDGSMMYAMLHPDKTGWLKSVIDADSRKIVGLHYVGFGIKNAFQYLDYLIKRPEGFTIDQMGFDINELFLNDLFPQLHRLRAGQHQLTDL